MKIILRDFIKKLRGEDVLKPTAGSESTRCDQIQVRWLYGY
jgi:hypothetical protein